MALVPVMETCRDNKGKRQQQQQKENAKSDPFLDLSLGSKNSNHDQLNSEINHKDCLKVGLSSFETLSDDHDLGATYNSKSKSEERRMFLCNYCNREFYSSQALGGHQNAHKRERSLITSNKSKQIMDFDQQYNHHQMSMASSLPVHSSLNIRSSLGIQAHSMIHKPSFYDQYGYGWSRSPVDHQSLGIGRLQYYHLQEGYMTSNGGGAGRFGAYDHERSAGDHELQKLDLSLKL